MDNYFNRPEINQTDIKNLLESYSHYVCERETDKEPTEAMKFGTALHAAILEPYEFERYKVFEGDKRTNGGKEYYNLLIADGFIPISQKDYDIIQIMKNKFLESKYGDLNGCKLEEPIYFKWGEFGCKAKPDAYNPKTNVIIDLKTIDKISNNSILYAVKDFKYYIQDVFYTQAIEFKYNVFTPQFVFAFFEKKPPYQLRFIELDLEWQELGFNKIKEAFQVYKKKDLNTTYYENLPFQSWIK